MALRALMIEFDELTADPSGPVEGRLWYNSTTKELKVYLNGVTEVVIPKSVFDAHALATTNPHSTTLEQARTAGSAFSGDVDLGGNDLLNVGGSGAGYNAASQQWTTEQINSKLKGLDWQNSVLDKDLTTAPGSPSLGDRYIIAGTGGGWSGGTINDIAEWTGSAWDFTTPNEGFACKVEDENIYYFFDGATWGSFGNAVQHAALIGLGNDDHTQYLLVSGARAMSGDLDMGTNDVTNVGLVDGVDVSNHGIRHNPGGADAATTAAPGATGVATASAEGAATSFARSDHAHQSNTAPADVTKAAAVIGSSGEPARADHKHDVSTAAPVSVGTANAEGAATSLARSNHIHDHGAQSTETHHAETSPTAKGFYPRSNFNAGANPTANDDSNDGYGVGSRWINVASNTEFVCVDATVSSAIWLPTAVPGAVLALIHKAGRALNAAFAGNPKKATVTFASAFADANYAVVATGVTTNDKQYALSIESQGSGSFVINTGVNNIADLVQVNWVAMKDGESS